MVRENILFYEKSIIVHNDITYLTNKCAILVISTQKENNHVKSSTKPRG